MSAVEGMTDGSQCEREPGHGGPRPLYRLVFHSEEMRALPGPEQRSSLVLTSVFKGPPPPPPPPPATVLRMSSRRSRWRKKGRQRPLSDPYKRDEGFIF